MKREKTGKTGHFSVPMKHREGRYIGEFEELYTKYEREVVRKLRHRNFGPQFLNHRLKRNFVYKDVPVMSNQQNQCYQE